MMGHDDDELYRARHGDSIPHHGPARWGEATPLVEMPLSWSLDDFPHFEHLSTATYRQQGLMRADHVPTMCWPTGSTTSATWRARPTGEF